MLAHDSFADTFGIAVPGDLDSLAGLIRKAGRAGYAIVLNAPGTKKANVCTLSDKAARDADRAAHAADLAAGVRNPRSRHDCGKAHALTAANTDAGAKVSTILGLVTRRYGGLPNIGVEPGLSRVVIADLDTLEQRDAFLAAWHAEDPTGDVPDPDELYTVRSPGHQKDGVWEHKDGGHVWFTLPVGVELPLVDNGVYTDQDKWSLYWSGGQVLVPPSVRAEGPYMAVGTPWPVPDWILARITTFVTERAARTLAQDTARRAKMASGDVDATNVALSDENTPWADLLAPRGWAETGRRDACGCLTWTAPGSHASPKSAVAHEAGCSHPNYDDDSGHRPIHLWSDTVLVSAPRTLTKLQFVAWWDHDGNVGAASRSLGLATRPLDGLGDFTEMVRAAQSAAPVVEAVTDRGSKAAEGDSDASTQDTGSTLNPQLVDGFDTPLTAADSPVLDVTESRWLDWNDLHRIPAPEPLITDVLDKRTMVVLAGKFGTYKTFLALDWAASLATGTSWAGHEVPQAVPVVYVGAEGAGSFDRRFTAWQAGRNVGSRPRGALTVWRGPVNVLKDEDMSQLCAAITEHGAQLLVVDTLHRCAPGIDENDAKEVGRVLERLFIIRDVLGIAVLVLHHTGHQGQRARGSSVIDDNADASWVISLDGENRGPDNPRTLSHRKSKDGELLGEVPLVLRTAASSAYLSYDPMDAPRSVKRVEAAAERAGDLAELVTHISEYFTQRGRIVGRDTTAIEVNLPAGNRLLREAHKIVSERWSKRSTDQLTSADQLNTEDDA